MENIDHPHVFLVLKIFFSTRRSSDNFFYIFTYHIYEPAKSQGNPSSSFFSITNTNCYRIGHIFGLYVIRWEQLNHRSATPYSVGSNIAGAPPPNCGRVSSRETLCTNVTDTIMVHSPPRANREVMRCLACSSELIERS